MAKNTAKDEITSAEKESLPVVHLNISHGRSKISQLVNGMDATHRAYALGQRKAPKALLVAYERYNPILSKNYKRKLAFTVVENLLGDAPSHLRNPQLDELTELNKHDLLLLVGIEKLPLSKVREKELRNSLREPKSLDRLVRRHQIACAISSAQKEGLYEANEHLTSKIDL